GGVVWVAGEEAAEGNDRPVGPALTQLIARQNGVVADVVNLVLARHWRSVRAAQNHVGGGAAGRRRVGEGRFKKAMLARVVVQGPDDLAVVIDAKGLGLAVHGIVDGGERAAAVEETVHAAAGALIPPDDLAQIVDAECSGAEGARQRIVESGVSAAVGVVEEAVVASGVAVRPDDLAGAVNALCKGVAAGGRGIVEGGVRAAAV